MMKNQRPWLCRLIAGLDLTSVIFVCGAFIAIGSSDQDGLLAQGLPGAEKRDSPTDDLQRLPNDRRVVQQLSELTAAAKRNDVNTARDVLEALRTAEPTLMVADPRGTFIPIHRDLVQRLQLMDAAFLKELAGTGSLDRQLSTALPNGPSAVLQILHQSAGTTSAWKAHLLLAVIHRDRGNDVAAQYWLRPLLTPSVPEEIRVAAEKMSDSISAAAAANNARATSEPVSGSPVSAAQDSAAQDSAAQDSAALSESDEEDDSESPEESVSSEKSRAANKDGTAENRGSEEGEAAGSNESAATNPGDDFKSGAASLPSLNVHWMQRVPLPENERRMSQEVVRRGSDGSLIPWSASEPVVDETHVFVRTPYLIKAFDRLNGRHLWTKILKKNQTATDSPSRQPSAILQQNSDAAAEAMNSGAVLSVHRNEITGRMTADSERLFAVCEVAAAAPITGSEALGIGGPQGMRIRLLLNENISTPLGSWELVAIEKSTGRRLWTMGGAPVEERFGNELAGCWFAGAPEVVGNELLTVVEKKGAMELAGLSAETGQLKWSIPLTFPDAAIDQDPARQLLAARVLCASGVIYVNSTTGWLFAVDSLTHSVLWGRKLPAVSTGQSQRSRLILRGVPVYRPLPPFGSVWRSEAPQMIQNLLTIVSAESSQLLLIEPLTGRIVHRTGASQSTLLLFADRDRVIVSSGKSLQAISVPGLRKIWSISMSKDDAVPVGHAAALGENLFIPMSNGQVDVRTIADGTKVTQLGGLRSPLSTGGFYSAGKSPQSKFAENSSTLRTNSTGIAAVAAGAPEPIVSEPIASEPVVSFVSFAPDRIALLSTETVDLIPDQDPLQRAMFLLETGQFPAARQTLDGISTHALNSEIVRRLRFQIATTELTITEGEARILKLAEISRLARTPEEIAISHLLQISQQASASPSTAAATLIDLLSEDESILSVEVPVPERLLKSLAVSSADPLGQSEFDTGEETLRLPLRSWICQQIRQLSATFDAAEKAEFLTKLQQLSDDDLLSLHSPEVASLCLQRAARDVELGLLKESTLHLLMAALSVSSEAGEPKGQRSQEIFSEATSLFTRLKSIAAEAADPHSLQSQISSRLLEVLHYELLAGKLEENLPSPAETYQQINERWRQLPEAKYTLLPVQTSGDRSFRQSNLRHVKISSSSDAFLSAFDWTIRREPGALLARSIVDPDLPLWSLKTTAEESAVVYSNEVLQRVGSVLLLETANGLSAFSAVDQRWLWTRPLQGERIRRRTLMGRQTFTNFHLAFANRRGELVGGATNRWVCLQTKTKVEVVDLLNGRLLWSMTGFPENDTLILACNDVVGIHTGRSQSGGDILAVNPLDGTRLKSEPDLSEYPRRLLTSTPDALVIWDEGSRLRRRFSLKWIQPTTRDVVRVIELSDMQAATFLDPETLAVITDEETFHVINLLTGDKQTYSYAGRNDLDSLEPGETNISADASNYYVYQQNDNGRMGMLGIYGLQAEPVDNQIRAVSRDTRKLLWGIEVEPNTLANIRGSLSPVLLLMNNNDDQGNNNPLMVPGLGGSNVQQWNMTGVSRITGSTLLNYKASVRSVNTNLQVYVLEGGTLDLDAFGNRVRFSPAPEPQLVP